MSDRAEHEARYEALAMYDRATPTARDRRWRANSCSRPGAKSCGDTAGHFDLPVMRTTITWTRRGCQGWRGEGRNLRKAAFSPCAQQRDESLQPLAAYDSHRALRMRKPAPRAAPRPSVIVAIDDLRRGIPLAAKRAGEVAACV